jgi:NAD(P)-dependent dehydrogenase (short-subunit alcohol dehydrogenase family)
LQATVGQLKTGAQTYSLNVADAAAIEMAIQDFKPTALVCCAAILGQGSVYEDLTPDRFAEVHSINVSGTYNACRAAMRLWRDQKIAGNIVNVSSLGGIRGMQKFPGFAAYASSKHAIVGLTEALAIEGRPHDIRVNAVAPGTLRTPMIEALGLRPKTTPDSIAGTIAFLLDRTQSQAISGTTIEVHCNDD